MASEGLTVTPNHLPYPGPAGASDCVTLVSANAAIVQSCAPSVVYARASLEPHVVPAEASGETPSVVPVRN